MKTIIALVFVLLIGGCMTPNITITVDGDGNTITIPQTKTVTTTPDVTVPLL